MGTQGFKISMVDLFDGRLKHFLVMNGVILHQQRYTQVKRESLIVSYCGLHLLLSREDLKGEERCKIYLY